jgi:hypothetical protein
MIISAEYLVLVEVDLPRNDHPFQHAVVNAKLALFGSTTMLVVNV